MSLPLPFMLWTLEEEGAINTPRGKRNAFIKELRSGAAGYFNFSLDEIRERAATAGFDSYDIEIIIGELKNDKYRSSH